MASGSGSFQRLSQDISNNIYKISNNVAQLQSIQKQLQSGKTDADLKSKFHDIQHYTHQLATETSSKMKELTNYQGPDVDQRTQKFQKEQLLNEFTRVLNTFQNIQRQEKDLEKKAINERVSNPFDDDEGPFGEQRGYQGQTMVQIDASEVDMEILRERDDALVKLESDISDVNQIFKDLSVLVHEQGEVIDTIEDNVVSAAVHVEQGTEELQKARKHQTSARKKKLIIFIVILVIIIIIAIILGVKLKN